MIKRPTTSALIAIALIAVGAALRVARDAGWVPLPPNVAPISAMAILSGLALPRRYALVVPLTAMLMSDLIIGFYTLPVMISFGLSNYIGHVLRRSPTVRLTLAASLSGSVLFFLLTNGAVWAFQTMYPHTIVGLGQAYLAGLPFFRNTLLGDLGFTALLVGGYASAVVYLRHRLTTAISTLHG